MAGVSRAYRGVAMQFRDRHVHFIDIVHDVVLSHSAQQLE
jgi:hypothetical protein